MATEREDLLVDEGVNEGSSESTAEAAGGPVPSGWQGAVPSGGTQDAVPSGSGPTSESDVAPPPDMGTDISREVSEAGPGQQLEAGEG